MSKQDEFKAKQACIRFVADNDKCSLWDVFRKGMEYARPLPVQGMRGWVNASKTLPPVGKDCNLKIDNLPFSGRFWEADSDPITKISYKHFNVAGKTILDSSHFYRIFWLDESISTLQEDEWISVDDKPLVTSENGRWWVNEGVPDEFLAAVEVHNNKTNKDYWWIRHCAILDGLGLCIVTDDDHEPAGWQISDVLFYQPLPSPPTKK
jgi:hypothetical protein